MHVSHEKIPGLDRERLHAAIEPVFTAHAVECVELVWRTDRGGWLLEISIERADARVPGVGVTIDLCADISRDLSAALDVADCIPHRYTLEVGSPGVERALYVRRDYERFAGQAARLKLTAPRAGQSVIFGTLHGLDDHGAVLLETEQGELASIELDTISSARILFEWKKGTGTRASAKGFRRREPSSLPAGVNPAGPRPQVSGPQPQNERRFSGKAKKSPPPQRSR